MCLVPGSRRRELERQDDPGDEASLAEVNVLEGSMIEERYLFFVFGVMIEVIRLAQVRMKDHK